MDETIDLKSAFKKIKEKASILEKDKESIENSEKQLKEIKNDVEYFKKEIEKADTPE